MKLDDPVVRNFAVAKCYPENNERVNSIDFTPDGLLLISSSDDDSIIIYDCQNGTKKRQVRRARMRMLHAVRKIDLQKTHCRYVVAG